MKMYIAAGKKVRVEVCIHNVKILEIADLPDIKNLSKVTFSGAVDEQVLIYDGKLLYNKVLFTNPRVSHTDIEFFDLNCNSIESCIVLIDPRQSEEYQQKNKGYISDIYSAHHHLQCSLTRHRSANVRVVPGSILPEKYLSKVNNYLRVYIYEHSGIIIINNIKADSDYHIMIDKPILCFDEWPDTFATKVLIYDRGILR